MKPSTTPLLCLAAAALCTTPALLHAAPQAGDNTARHVQLYPDLVEGKEVRLDTVLVTPLNHASAIEGLTCRVAHTHDKKNASNGGEILVILPTESRERFDRRFGTAIDNTDKDKNRDRRKDGPKTNSLTGKVRILDKSRLIVIDWEGLCGDKIDKHIDKVRENAGKLGGGRDDNRNKDKAQDNNRDKDKVQENNRDKTKHDDKGKNPAPGGEDSAPKRTPIPKS